MKSHYSFIGSVFQTCSGISGFRVLCRHSWLRTILHVIMMALLCALLITWGESSRRAPLLQAAVSVFKTVFGEKVLNTPAGLVPEKNPSDARHIGLPDGGRLWYFPSGKVRSSIVELEKCPYIIFWAPRGFASALQKDTGKWMISTVVPDDDRILRAVNRTVSSAELAQLNLENGEKWDFDDFKTLTADEIYRSLSGVLSIGYFFQNLVLTLVLPLLYTSFFMGMFRLSSGRRYPVTLTYREFWKLGLYAGFPALLIASAFPALDLPLFSFSSIYMAALLIYWLYAASRIERENRNQEPMTEDEQ